jgi:hypothetical protein
MEEYRSRGTAKDQAQTVKNKIALGIFRKGVHYFSPAGLGPRFKWSAVVAWLEHSQEAATENGDESIPMPRSYRYRELSTKQITGSS